MMRPIRSRNRHIFYLILFMIVFVGCAPLTPRPFQYQDKRPQHPVQFFKAIDDAVNASGVNDASAHQVFGFPYLSVNRFLAALGPQLENQEQQALWFNLMMRLNIASREKEIHNLPEREISRLTGQFKLAPGRDTVIEHMRTSAFALSETDRMQKEYFEAVKSAAIYPDEYITAYRILGLYPLTSLPVAYLTNRTRKQFKTWFSMPLGDLPVTGELVAYAPAANSDRSEKDILDLFRTRKNALNIPQLNENQVKDLAIFFAPLLVQDVSGLFDRPGQVIWEDNRVNVDPSKPAVYYYLSYAFYKGMPVLQMNYVIWYSDRKGPEAPWIERGHFDGITVRMTFDPKGSPYMVDIMNNCGCYHLFVPNKVIVKNPISKPMALDPFVPQWLPPEFPSQRLSVRINSGWHQTQRVFTEKHLQKALPYQLLPYHTLEMLPHPDGRTESIFNAKGIGKNSFRIEPYLLFSMGIPDVGSMRQRGRHAIKLVGRAHFDDPNFFKQNFAFK